MIYSIIVIMDEVHAQGSALNKVTDSIEIALQYAEHVSNGRSVLLVLILKGVELEAVIKKGIRIQ
jgi:hypothetical protein